MLGDQFFHEVGQRFPDRSDNDERFLGQGQHELACR